MKKVFLSILFTTIGVYAYAQQQPMVRQYMLNQYYFNPAYANAGERYNFSFLHRSQWSGYQDYRGNTGAPQMQLFTATANTDSTGHSFGLLMSRDNAGLLTTLQAQLSYGYRIRLSKRSTLALAARGGIVTRSVNGNEYIVMHPDDALIRGGRQSETKSDLTLGLWYGHEQLYAGISAKGFVVRSRFDNLAVENERALTATVGYDIKLSKEWELTPSVQATHTDRTAFQGGAMLNKRDAFWAGLSYSAEEAASVIIGFGMLKRNLRVSYCFDYVTGDRGAKADTSHEFMLAYRAGQIKR